MKKLLAVAFVLCTVTSYAQLQVGLKAGVNVSNFTGGDFQNFETKSRVGFHGGGFLRWMFGKVALQPELLFSTQGAKLDSAGTEKDYKVNYLNIPIMLQYEMNGGFYLEAGPQFGFKLDEDVPEDINSAEDFANSSDVAIALGLGYHTKMGFGLGARYNVGVSKVGNFETSNISPDFKNGVLQFSIFYTFLNNKK
jgi:hypothetical protein